MHRETEVKVLPQDAARPVPERPPGVLGKTDAACFAPAFL